MNYCLWIRKDDMNFISCKFAKIISIFLMMIVVIVSLICPFNAAMADGHVSGVTDLSATPAYIVCPSWLPKWICM